MDIAIYILSTIAIALLLGGLIGFGSAKLFKELSKLEFLKVIIKPLDKIDKIIENIFGLIVWLIFIISIWLFFNPIFFYVNIESYFKDKKSKKEYLTGNEGKLLIFLHFPVFLFWIASVLKIISVIAIY